MRTRRSNLPRIICPVQQRLPLPAAAVERARRTIFLDLRDVPPHCSPSLYLPLVVRTPATEIIPAIPLKPAAWIFLIDPAVSLPDRKRLRGVHFEEIQIRIVLLMAQPCVAEPGGGKLSPAISQVLAAKDAQFEHLWRSELRSEIGVEILAGGFGQVIDVATLHQIVNLNSDFPFSLHQSDDLFQQFQARRGDDDFIHQ